MLMLQGKWQSVFLDKSKKSLFGGLLLFYDLAMEIIKLLRRTEMIELDGENVFSYNFSHWEKFRTHRVFQKHQIFSNKFIFI